MPLSPEQETDAIIKANDIWDAEKHLIRDVQQVIRQHCKRLTTEERKAIQEAGRAGFVLGYLKALEETICDTLSTKDI